MSRSQALEAIEHACQQKAELRFTGFYVPGDRSSGRALEARICTCARDRISGEFRDDDELNAIAGLERIMVQMGETSTDDFRALEHLRLEYNGVLDRLRDQGRRRQVVDASREAVAACRNANNDD